jgi:tetratricopeptide (TPR) repeat protein
VRGVGGRDSTIAACERALDLARRAGGDDLALARTQRAYGIALRLMGRFDDAQAQHDQALALFERLQQPQWVALARGELAELAYLRGDPARCLELIDAALAQLTAQLGSDNALRYGLLSTRSQCRLGSGNATGAEADLREALALVEHSVGSGAPVGNRGQLLNDLGLVLNQGGRFAESEPLLRESLAIAEKIYGPSHPELAPVLASLSQALDGQGHVEEGITLLRRAADLSAQHQGDGRRMHAIMLNNLGFRLLREGRYADAEPILREALAVYVALDPQHPDRAATLVNLGTLLLETGKPRDALPLLRDGLALREKHMQPGSWQIETARSVLGACLVAVGQEDQGRALLQSSHDALLALFGPEHKRTRDAKRRLDAANAVSLPGRHRSSL